MFRFVNPAQQCNNHNTHHRESKKLALGSSLAEVAEAMRDPMKGVCLLQRQPCLPALTFVAGDATAWVCDHVEGVTSEVAAVDLLQVRS